MDYKLRLSFIRLDPFFKGGQLALPFFSGSDKCQLSQLSFIEVHHLGQTSLNFRQSCPLCHLLLQDVIILGSELLQPSDLLKTHRFSFGQKKIGLFDNLSGLLNLILNIKKSAVGSINSISNLYLPCLQGLQVWRYHLDCFLHLQVSFSHLDHETFKLFIYWGIQVWAVEVTPLTHVLLKLLHQKLQCSSLVIPSEISDILNVSREDHL